MNDGLTRSTIAVLIMAGALLAASSLWAQTADALVAEMEGTDERSTGPLAPPDPAAREVALGALGGGGLLLIPESSNDRVMAFDATSGNLIDPDFIPADPGNLSTPIQAMLSPDGTQVYVSDQVDDVVQAYDLDTGAFVGTFAPAGGANTAILDNIRGIAYRPNGNLLVSVGSGANADAIAEFDGGGNYVGNFVANGAGGLDSPFDVFAVVSPGGVLAAGDFLVPGISSDAVHRYDSTGAAQADFASLNSFGEQVAQAANGNVLVGNFSGTQEGVVEFLPDGTVFGIYDPPSLGGYRGAYELPTGNILTTNGSGVHEIDRAGNLVETKIAGVSARFITLAGGGAGSDVPRTTFAVNKDFDDDNPASVEVTLSCNTGLPLQQSATIEEGVGVVFVVVDFNSGDMNCEVSEGSHLGYATTYDDGTAINTTGCAYTGVNWGDANTCVITNSLQVVDVTVTKWWMDENPQFNAVNYAEAAYDCVNEQFGIQAFGTLEFLGDGDTQDFSVFPHWNGTTTCNVNEIVVENGIEFDDSECQGLSVTPGSGASCNIYNTRLYEGIPTLNHYSLALMAMLMLGVGFVAFRRYG